MDQPDFKKIAAQLRKPTGQDGIVTAQRMSVNNEGMIKKCIDHLNIKDNEQVLEIGPGGGLHVSYLLEKANQVTYTGADISDTMIAFAKEQNAAFVAKEIASFVQVQLKDGYAILPFADNNFDSIFTVNTLYFWDDAGAQASEIRRVLKPGGIFALCFATEAFMSALPFTQFGFSLYTVEKAKALLEATGFTIKDIITEKENVMAPEGKLLEREFIVMLARK